MSSFTQDYLLYLLAQASGRASAAFHSKLADQRIPVSTWRILATLYPDDPASIGELCKSCLTKQPTMTRQVDRLETAGLVARDPVPTSDRRRVHVRLTAKGRALADRLVADAKAHEACVLNGHSASDIAALKSALRTLASDE